MGIGTEANLSREGREEPCRGRGWPGRGGTGTSWWGLGPELRGQIRWSQAILLHQITQTLGKVPSLGC